MVRWLIFLLGMLTTRAGTSYPAEEGPWPEPGDPEELAGHGPDGTWIMSRDPPGTLPGQRIARQDPGAVRAVPAELLRIGWLPPGILLGVIRASRSSAQHAQ